MPEKTRTARETIDLLLRTIVDGTRDDLADLYAPDVVVTNLFAPEGVPASVKGNEALRSRMVAMGSLLRYHAVEDVVIHETQDPETVVVEFAVRGTILASGAEFKLAFINVIRVVDGLVAESRDYSDAVRASKLFEELQAS